MSISLPTPDELRALAGSAAFERGRRYAAERRVESVEWGEDALRAQVRGSRLYRVRLALEGESLEWSCQCQAAAGGDFCKHLVALGLAALNREEAEDALLAALRRQPVERLAEWLYEQARRDDSLSQKLRLRVGAVDPQSLRKTLSAALAVRGHLDYRAVRNYVQRLEAPLELLQETVRSAPEAALPLAQYALERLLKIWRRADDSGGLLGERVHEFAEIFRAAAAAARPEPRELARTLFRLQREDEASLLPLAGFWSALGTDGQAVYAELVEREFAALAPPGEGDRYDAKTFGVLSRAEALARLRGDLPALVAALSYDLSSAYAYERVARACLEFEREREATQWAERGLAAHPGATALQGLLAQLYAAAGLDEEAMELAWKRFVHAPGAATWQALKALAGADWPPLRDRALAQVLAEEEPGEDGRPRVDLRARLLLADGDLAGARAAVEAGRASPAMLEEVAQASAADAPQAAATLLRRAVELNLRLAAPGDYPRQVKLMARAIVLDPEPGRAWLGELRRLYARRPKLMALLGKLD